MKEQGMRSVLETAPLPGYPFFCQEAGLKAIKEEFPPQPTLRWTDGRLSVETSE